MNLTLFSAVVILPLLTIAILLIFARLLRGPSLPDRVIALDMIATLGIGVVGVYALVTNQPAYLDVALLLALLAFLGTVAFAYFIESTKASRVTNDE
ncbi:MAG: hypothetical protein Kow0031_40850 [Anaerolineae bacterium]